MHIVSLTWERARRSYLRSPATDVAGQAISLMNRGAADGQTGSGGGTVESVRHTSDDTTATAASCHWCLGSIRYAPDGRRWRHERDGREARGDRGVLAEYHAEPSFEQRKAAVRNGTTLPQNAPRLPAVPTRRVA
jgi:hypothetical protein